MKRNFMYLLFIYAGFISKTSSQDLTTFISEGLSSNTQLQQKQMSEQVALAALNEAKKLKSLNVDFAPTYTLAAGGRSIDVPIGDLLNPVYLTLNDLTASDRFPQVENANELLNPNNFYDVRFRATYPIINKEIPINKDIKEAEVAIASFQTEQYTHQLIKEISAAYYEVHQSQQVVEIYKNAIELIKEVLRVNRGLLQVGKALPIDVYTAEDDSLQLATQYLNAQIANRNAIAFLNFLTNKPLDRKVLLDDLQDLPAVPIDLVKNDRPELKELDQLLKIQGNLAKLAKASTGPKLNAFIDAGVQDFDFNIDAQSPYVLAGLTFSFNVYDGGKTKSKIKLAETKIKEVQMIKNAIEESIAIETFTTRQNIDMSMNGYEAAKTRTSISEKRYKQSVRRYIEGTMTYLDVQQLRNNLLTSRLEQNIARFDIYKQVAEYDRVLSNTNY